MKPSPSQTARFSQVIAGLSQPDWIQGRPLPTSDADPGFERAICEWDSQFPGYGMHLRSIVRDGWMCTAYEESTDGQPNGLEKVWGDSVLRPCGVHYDGTEGELYNLVEDPHQWHNLWDDPAYRAQRDDLVADMVASFPTERRVLPVEAPA